MKTKAIIALKIKASIAKCLL